MSTQPTPALLNATGHSLLRSIVDGQGAHLLAAACPLAAPQVATAGDTDAADIATLPAVLDVGDMRSFASLAELCENAGLFEPVTCDKDFGQNLTPAARSAFGRLLKRFDGRVVGPGIRFVIEGSGRNRVYGLRPA